jgi:CRP-like cAMP-binding protein
MNSKDANELPKELVKLGRNAHFGEIALLTAEPRSATVTVISNDAKCLRMTKQKFDELLVATNQIQAENRKLIGRDVLDTVPLFKSLTSTNKKKLLDAMLPMSYHQNSYICRQGTAGNVFFILTEGACRITVNSQDGQEREVARLHPGDFFGKCFLILCFF